MISFYISVVEIYDIIKIGVDNMKRIIYVFLMFFIVLLTGCSQAGYVGIPKGYIEKHEFYDEHGFQDYTDYAKYIYSDNSNFINNDEYQKLSNNDIDNIKGYFRNFKGWMEAAGRLDEYDFDQSIINEGDYVKIKTLEGQPIGNSKYKKYDDYSVYFFDSETKTLYYIHSNI